MIKLLRESENSGSTFLIAKWLLYVILLIQVNTTMRSQSFDNFGKAKLVKVNGGVSANSVFYEGPSNREAFTYFVSGNVNFNIKGIFNIPLSFSYSNQEFDTGQPFSYNRLSIHPSYKWIATHIGDVNMSFSPYTLNGHQFSGFGADLTPDKPYALSFMYGRLQKEVDFSEQDSLSVPVYKRIGYGLKSSYKFDKIDLAITAFKASDDESSISPLFPAQFGVTPKDNFVGSLESNISLLEKIQLHFEVASSVITEDTKATTDTKNKTLFSSLVKNNATTQQFKAFNVDVSYPVANGTVGATYERIDPDYRTLGAYFFNNDLENITINASQNILNNKVTIAINGGLQRDDLNNTKDAQLQRLVSAINLGFNPNDKLNFTGSYSNFQSYTNIKNQFDVINEVAPGENLDTLDFQQIAQNASLGVGYQLKSTKEKTQNLNLNLSMQTSVSKQNEKVTDGGLSNFYNTSGTYNLSFPQRNLTIATSANATFNELADQKTVTFGPTVSVAKQLFDKKLRTSLSTSYNQSNVDSEKQSDVINLRANAGYVYAKKHNFNLSLLSQIRNGINTESTTDFTATLSYSYSFDTFKVKLPKPTSKERDEDPSEVRFTYRDSVYQGTKSSINNQLRNLQNHVQFKGTPSFKKEELVILRNIVAEEKKNTEYKQKALVFLEQLYNYSDFQAIFKGIMNSVIFDLYSQMQRMDYQLEQGYVNATLDLKGHTLYNEDSNTPNKGTANEEAAYEKLVSVIEQRKSKLIGHRWMRPEIEKYTENKAFDSPDANMQTFIDNEKDKVYRMYSNAPNTDKIKGYVIGQLIDYYYNLSLKKANQNKFELLHTLKN